MPESQSDTTVQNSRRRSENLELVLRSRLIETTYDAVIGINQSGQIIDWNSKAEEIYGWKKEEVLGRDIAATIIPSIYHNGHYELLKKIQSNDNSYRDFTEVEVEGLHRDGHVFPVELIIVPILSEDHFYLYYFVKDISNRRKTVALEESFRRRLSLQNDIMKILTASTEPLPTLKSILEKIGRANAWEIGIIWLVHKKENILKFENAWTDFSEDRIKNFLEESKNWNFHVGEGLPGQSWQSGDIEWISEASENGRFLRRKQAQLYGLKHGFWMPVSAGSQVFAVLEFMCSAPRVPDKDFLQAMTTLSWQISQALQRMETQKSLSETVVRYKTYISQSTEALWRLELEKPIEITDPPEKQVEEFINQAYVAECNQLMGEAFEIENLQDLIGIKITGIAAKIENQIQVIKEFITSGYRLHEYEAAIRRHDGSIRYYLNNSLGIVENGKLVRTWGSLRDITEKKLIEKKLNQSQERLRLALDSGKIGTWDIDPKTGEIHWDERCYELAGIEPFNRPFYFKDFEDLVHPDDRETVNQAVARAYEFDSGGDYHVEFRLISSQKKKETWVLASGKVYFEENKSPYLFIGTVSDISDRKRFEQEVALAKQAAENANRAKSQFLANMSHEIRTPLGAIIGFTSLLEEPNLSEQEKREYIAIIHRNGDELQRLIDDILDLSKIEAGKLDIEFGRINIRSLLLDIRTSLRIKALAKNLDLSLDVKPEVPESITTDRTRLRQILVNIVGNGIKFTQRGKVQITVDVKKDQSGRVNDLVFLISDTGLGISREQARKLFKPFSQADSSTTRKFGGTGLGLALSRRLASAIQGDLRLIRSEVGVGSTFYLSLPIEPVTTADKYQHVFPKAKSTDESEILKLKNSKILVVEDSIDNQKLIERILSKRGALVSHAENGAQGVDMALNSEIDCILMDIQMPVLDGYKATQLLREKGFTKPIIALTAHAMKEDRDRCLEAGCNTYLTKPIDTKILVSTLQKCLNKESVTNLSPNLI